MTVEAVLLSWSGGKDAAWTLHRLRQSGVPVAGLITTVTAGYERVSMQGIRREVLHAQAMAAGLPLIEAMIPPACDNAVYEAAFASQLQEALRSDGLFKRWRDAQADPDGVDASLGATDPGATVKGEQHDLQIDLIVVTSIPGSVFKHRLRLLAGSAWELRDVSSA